MLWYLTNLMLLSIHGQVQSNAANMENAIAGIARSKLVGISPNNEDSEILDMLVSASP